MKKLVVVLFVLAPLTIFAQNYNVSLIPDSLKEHAKAVKRFEELRVIIKSPSRAVIKHKWAVTILNEEGRRFSGYSNMYDKLRSINSIDGTLYDANGKELKSVKKKDIADLADDDAMNLMTDNRYKQHVFYYSSYPYTVEYEDEIEMDGIYSLPRWQPVEDEKYAVQQSRLIVEAPLDYQLRYRLMHYTDKPVITPGAKFVNYQWEIKNIPPIKHEMYQPEWDEILPGVIIAPTKFEFGGYQGDMSTWEGIGKYGSGLYVGRDVLPDNIKADIHRLSDNLNGTTEKICALYNYLQSNTRYISIQLGIGGLQPFPAKEVATKKYGDCKALSNYMVSILKEAGIKAYSVWVKAGKGEKGLIEDFPVDYFNHVIVCVPATKDTTWLECTNQTASAGYMGSFTGNRKALMLADDGGHVVNTPHYGAAENLQLRRVEAVIDADGNLTAEVNTRFTGEQQELQHSLIYSVNKKEREDYLNEALSLPTYKIEKSEYKEEKGFVPAVKEYIKLVAPNYASVTGKRLFITPNLFNRSSIQLSTDEPRKFDIEFTNSFRDEDTILISLPKGYDAEALPKDVDIQSKFGKYSVKYKLVDSRIEVIRKYETDSRRYPASDYLNLAAFFDQKYKADRSKIVLIKKEG